MKNLKTHFSFLFLLILFCTTGCQDKKSPPKPNPELLNIELLRGDLVLCGGNQFGKVNFSLSCNKSVREAFNLAVTLITFF